MHFLFHRILVKKNEVPKIAFAGTEAGQRRKFEAERRRIGTACNIECAVKFGSVNDDLSMEKIVTAVLAGYIDEQLQRLAVMAGVIGNFRAGYFGIIEGDYFRTVFYVACKEGDLFGIGIVGEFTGCG